MTCSRVIHILFLLALAAVAPLVGCTIGDDDDDDFDASLDGSLGDDAAVLPDAALDGGDAGEAGDDDSGAELDAGEQDEDGGIEPPTPFRPEPAEPTDERIAALDVAPGFELNVYRRGLGHARMLATHGDHVYLTRPMQGDVLRLVDSDADGVAESQQVVASDLMGVHGIAFRESTVFLATPKSVYTATIDASGNFGAPAEIISDLPDGAQHPNRTLGIGPDGKLYISVGSSCNACAETNPEHATMLRAELDGSARTSFATGLRNTIGFDWHASTSVLWGMDHGSDWLGDDIPPEELNRLESGKNYGWPYCYGERLVDPVIQDPPNMTKEAYCAMTVAPEITVQAHGAPIAFKFYQGTSFPESYRSSAFLALRGSWNRSEATGYKIVRLTFDAAGEPIAFEDFVTGFLIEDGTAEIGRLAGITFAPDGALLFSDDENGIVYRVQAAD
jgi:glucose/arabinose dehydrogenase